MTRIRGRRDPKYARIRRKMRQRNQERFGTNKEALDFKKTVEEKKYREGKAEEEEEEEEKRKRAADAVNFLEDEKIIAAIGEELAKEFCEEKGKIEKGHEIIVDFYRLGFVARVVVIEVISRTSKLKMICEINGKEILIDLSGYIKTLKKMQNCKIA